MPFFCAVEELHNPALCGCAFAVGGRPEERGVVASCFYPARRSGVRYGDGVLMRGSDMARKGRRPKFSSM